MIPTEWTHLAVLDGMDNTKSTKETMVFSILSKNSQQIFHYRILTINLFPSKY